MTDNDPIQAAARADFCRFLAACYYEPAPAFAEEKLFESMVQAAENFDPTLAAGAQRLGEAFAAESLEDLLVDYTRLFLGPVEAPARPYGSVWMSKEAGLMRDSTMDVIGLYAEGGFDLAEDFRELPDHVAAELEFLYLLLFRESRGQGSDAFGETGDPALLRKRLMAEHVGRWAAPFTEAVRAHAQCAFYRELGELTGRFVDLEVRRAAGA